MDGGDKAAFCKCDDDWTCTITKTTDPSKSGKAFSNCSGGPCCCSIKATESLSEEELKQAREGSPPANSKVFCVCPEGWSCEVSKTAGPDAGKVQFQCGEGCACVVGENDAFKIASV
ncbi:PREDICTED: uncharacterized protein LOC109152967 [Ipomoea nil]|uniref:uncharacterized protein LOC109152967 n=1 Tax=Ipomoea nil TaxID=35883 RepID=UPI000900ECCC|nr:PREDICTED: uncharacterized protein LOC109152967 [Ipomoea nil]